MVTLALGPRGPWRPLPNTLSLCIVVMGELCSRAAPGLQRGRASTQPEAGGMYLRVELLEGVLTGEEIQVDVQNVWFCLAD